MNARPLFNLGQIVATPGALEFLETNQVFPANLLNRHLGGDWGDLDAEDKRMNDHAATVGYLRILSAYKIGTGKVWIITEADRSSTTILLPDEY
jgi:hypothetical protein